MTDGIKIATLEVQDITTGYRFDLVSGGLDELPTYEGEDDTVPTASGKRPGVWTARTRRLKLHGIVFGSGSTLTARRASYRTRANALQAVMLPTALVSVALYPPNEGLTGTQVATLTNCRPMSITGPPAEGWEVRELELELECIKSPPTWAITGSP